MDTNLGNKLLLKEEVYQIVGSAIEVLNEIGHGLHAKPYENALAVEFGIRNIPFQQQVNFDVLYKGHKGRAVCPRPYCIRDGRGGCKGD